MKQKVIAFSQVDQDVLSQLKQQYDVVEISPKLGDVNEQIRAHVQDADGMIGAGRLLNASNLTGASRLKVVSSISVGYDNYDVDYLTEQKIYLCHTPHVLTETTADLAFSLLMGAARQLAYLDRWTKQGEWKRTVGPAQFGQDIHGKTLGIIGLGNIGAAIARGSVVNEQALIEALKQQKIFAAGLDVYEKEPLQSSELFGLDNVLTLPHIGSATAETRKKMAWLAYKNLVDVLEGRQPGYAVNGGFA
ncbi:MULTISPECIES: NAD(P)-dependent oxidoreductase [unclassified Acinetobacter]|uniref:NAD(P)-dependent oxidoreductase n=1 Tax=unclassified Acinetobacter TaxID=196816 RepID=UPI0015D1633C|nr:MULTISPECIES: NAD(P)-dependent oxidoreductase [unclassified Acinetobacter]